MLGIVLGIDNVAKQIRPCSHEGQRSGRRIFQAKEPLGIKPLLRALAWQKIKQEGHFGCRVLKERERGEKRVREEEGK